jgi:hypothetical protein
MSHVEQNWSLEQLAQVDPMPVEHLAIGEAENLVGGELCLSARLKGQVDDDVRSRVACR